MFRIISFLLLLVCSNAFAQLPPKQVVQSPNVASLGTYGEIPVSHATGTPNISVPLYNIAVGEVSVPIELSYHQASVRPNEHPGWVGLGWNLSVGGAITRKINGWPDEFENVGIFQSYYSNGRQMLAASDWDSSNKLKTYFSVQNNTLTDTEPDEFYFRFPGFSGKFMLTASGWQVDADKDVKVELMSFIKAGIESRIKANLPGFNNLDPILSEQMRSYYQFRLTTEDGTQYIFGGRDSGNEDAVDYHITYKASIDGYIPNAWHLIQIIQTNGDIIDFKYHRKYPVCTLAFNSDWFEMNGTGPQNCGSWGSQNITTTKHGGSAMFPAYLDEIVWKHGSAKFITSYSTELRYSENFFKYVQDYGQEVNAQWLISSGSPGPNYDNLKWEQLDEVQIRRTNGEIIQKYAFQYSNSTTQRLTLNSLQEKSSGNATNKSFSFYYNDVASLPAYGGDKTDHWGYYNNRSIDGISFVALETGSNATKNKLPNESVITKGLLNKIVYPTGGYTEFDWEIHQYGKVLATTRLALDNTPGSGGGCRIKEIRSYSNPGVTPITKTYYYVLNYNGSPTGLTSSGELNGKPQYYAVVSPRQSAFGEYTISYSYGGVTSTTNYGVFTQGSPVGYTEIVEKYSDNSYTKFIYSGFGPDLYNVSHFDKLATTIGWKAGEDRFITTSSLERERGKLLQTTHYTATKKPIERKEYRYNDDPNRFNSFFRCTKLNNSLACSPSDALILGAAYKNFTYRYFIKSETLINYNDDLTENLITTDYTYNTYGMIASISKSKSDGSIHQTLFRYPTDYSYTNTAIAACQTADVNCRNNVEFQFNQCSSACGGNSSCLSGCLSAKSGQLSVCVASYQQCLANAVPGADWLLDLKAKNIYNSVIEKQERIITNGSTQLVGGTLTTYKKANPNLYVPSLIYSMELSSPSSTLTLSSIGSTGSLQYHSNYKLSTVFDVYDNTGNLLQYHETDDINKSYQWGHQNSFPFVMALNAKTSEIFFDSFEEATGWDANLTQYDDTFAHNGKYAGKISKSTAGELASQSTKWLSVSSSIPVKYKYSGWIYSNKPSADVCLLMKTNTESGAYTYIDCVSTTAIGNWVFIEKEFVVPSNITKLNLRVDNNGGGIVWFDDLRLHPESAKLSTYTFDPMRGVTSMADENNDAQSFEYDSFNRLKLIRDQDNKILKQFVYHYQNQ